MARAARLSAYAPTRTVSFPIQDIRMYLWIITCQAVVQSVYCLFYYLFTAPGAVGHLSFTDILDTSLKVSWKEPQEKNGVLTGNQ